jgi:precorrin-3B C17-methyltransferase
MPAGLLTLVGLGPGDARWLTPAASEALAAATDLVGYGPYLARVGATPGQRRHASDNRVELERAHFALELAEAGRRVAVVSGGDPGVFAMAAAVFEALEVGDGPQRHVEIRVEPGVTALLAAAARVGAPLGGDFCALSLSDNLKPWDIVERRLRAALGADFVVALYNPVSSARPWQLGAALRIAAEIRDRDTPVVFARAVGRPNERVLVVSLAEADAAPADMSTLVIIGASTTRRVERAPGKGAFVYTPRFYGARP